MAKTVKNEKRISVTEFKKAVDEKCSEAIPPVVTDEWNGIQVTMRTSLPMNEMIAFVQEVVELSFTEDGQYVPEVIDVLIKRGVLSRYANFNLPADLVRAYELIYHSDAFEFVVSHINSNQLTEIVNAISVGLKYRCDSDVTALRAKVEELVVNFSDAAEKLDAVLNGISSEDVASLITAMSSGQLDEAKLVEAFLSQKIGDDEQNADVEHVVSPIKS